MKFDQGQSEVRLKAFFSMVLAIMIKKLLDNKLLQSYEYAQNGTKSAIFIVV